MSLIYLTNSYDVPERKIYRVEVIALEQCVDELHRTLREYNNSDKFPINSVLEASFHDEYPSISTRGLGYSAKSEFLRYDANGESIMKVEMNKTNRPGSLEFIDSLLKEEEIDLAQLYNVDPQLDADKELFSKIIRYVNFILVDETNISDLEIAREVLFRFEHQQNNMLEKVYGKKDTGIVNYKVLQRFDALPNFVK